MSKERRTVTLDPAADEHLGKDGVNASELVNKLVLQHANAGGNRRAMLELRAEQLQSDLEELQNRIETKREQLTRVNERLSEMNSGVEEVAQEVAELPGNFDVSPDSSVIQHHANENGVPADTLANRVAAIRETE